MSSFTFHINLFDLAALGAIFIGLAFALLLAFTKSANHAANCFLALALLIMASVMALLLAGDVGLVSSSAQQSRLLPQLSLMIGPLVYFYTRKITRPGYKFKWMDLLHFSPVLVPILISCFTTPPRWLGVIFQFSIFTSITVYLYFSHGLIPRFNRDQKNNVTDHYRHELWRLRRLLGRFNVLWVILIPYVALIYSGHNNQLYLYSYYALCLLLAVIMIWLGAVAFSWPEVRLVVQAPPVPTPSPTAELVQKGVWLKKAMKAGQFYLDGELTLSTLAEKLDTNPHELSRIINTALKKNFNDFVSEYRVRDVILKMQDPAYDRITLLGIAYDSGFNSKTTFHRIFKQMTGKSPAEYKIELKKDIPTYKLEPRGRLAPLILNQETVTNWSPDRLKSNYMFRNYLKIAWRNLVINKVYSALNITGLAAGMAVALLIGLWVFNQFSYDRFLPNYNQLYQVRFNFTDPKEGTHTQPSVCLPLADVLRNTIPGIKRVAETDWVGYNVSDLKVGDKKLLVTSGDVDPDFLKIFQYPFVKGNPNTALNSAYSIVIDESTAKALFGDADPMDKTIRVDNQHDVKVAGVFKDIPATASLKFGCLLSFSYKDIGGDWIKSSRTQWGNNSFEMFAELQPGVTQEQIAPKIKDLLIKYSPNYKVSKGEVIFTPVKDQHLYNDYENGKVVGGFIDYVRMFSVIGALVLLIACINFTNLSTARSEKRAREVGVRKAIGSHRKDLIFQFLTESLMITFAAFLVSVLLVQLALGPFNALTGGSVSIPYGSPVFWLGMLGYVLLTGLLAGSRPAFYLSSFNPVRVLKGTLQVGKQASLPRKVLVVLQFSCSVALIISTAIIYKQIQYVKDRPVGYNTDRLVSTFMSHDLMNSYDALKHDLLQSRMVESATKASSPLTDIFWHLGINKWPGMGAGELGLNVAGITVTDDYFKTVGMKLKEGRDFSSDWAADTMNVIVNETAVKQMNLKEPINQLISYSNLKYQVRIIGVVQDALIESPFTPAEPTVFNHGRGPNVMIYRLASGVNPHEALEKIGKIFDKYNPAFPFDYVFVDAAYNQKFGTEELIGTLAAVFAALAIFISCLGLFGLAAYVAEQRTKEVGIRKVMGASIAQVWMLLSRDFVILVVISCFIAAPISLYFLIPWLKKYQYHISIGPGIFLVSAGAALVITIVTVSFQAIKAAVTNPVRSLRSE